MVCGYRLQSTHIRQRLKSDRIAGKAQVLPVESIQGREQKVVIVSTVRSSSDLRTKEADVRHGLGFMFHEGRLNTAITRAASLLLIVGDDAVLAQDPTWHRLLTILKREGAFKPAADADAPVDAVSALSVPVPVATARPQSTQSPPSRTAPPEAHYEPAYAPKAEPARSNSGTVYNGQSFNPGAPTHGAAVQAPYRADSVFGGYVAVAGADLHSNSNFHDPNSTFHGAPTASTWQAPVMQPVMQNLIGSAAAFDAPFVHLPSLVSPPVRSANSAPIGAAAAQQYSMPPQYMGGQGQPPQHAVGMHQEQGDVRQIYPLLGSADADDLVPTIYCLGFNEPFYFVERLSGGVITVTVCTFGLVPTFSLIAQPTPGAERLEWAHLELAQKRKEFRPAVAGGLDGGNVKLYIAPPYTHQPPQLVVLGSDSVMIMMSPHPQ